MYHKIMKMNNIPEKLLNLGQKKKYKKNENVINIGDSISDLYLLTKGELVQITYSKFGTMIYDFLILAPSAIGGINDENYKSISTFKCIEDSEIIIISKNNITNIINTDYEIKCYIDFIPIKLLSIFINRSATSSIEERMVDILLEFAEEFGENINGKIKINYKLSQPFMSNLLGVSRRTTFGIFKKLQEENLLEYNDGYYYIKDLEQLRRY